MSVRRIAIAVVALALPVDLTACGSATEEEFCSSYDALYTFQEGVDMPDEREGLKELYGNLPDGASDEVKDAAEYLADNHSGSADLRKKMETGDLPDDEEDRMFSALSTFGSYGQETCVS